MGTGRADVGVRRNPWGWLLPGPPVLTGGNHVHGHGIYLSYGFQPIPRPRWRRTLATRKTCSRMFIVLWRGHHQSSRTHRPNNRILARSRSSGSITLPPPEDQRSHRPAKTRHRAGQINTMDITESDGVPITAEAEIGYRRGRVGAATRNVAARHQAGPVDQNARNQRYARLCPPTSTPPFHHPPSRHLASTNSSPSDTGGRGDHFGHAEKRIFNPSPTPRSPPGDTAQVASPCRRSHRFPPRRHEYRRVGSSVTAPPTDRT